jgi:hypothetical protein
LGRRRVGQDHAARTEALRHIVLGRAKTKAV